MNLMNGKKTYLVGIGSILAGVGGYLTGTIQLENAIQLVVTGLSAITIRHGVSTSTSGAPPAGGAQ